MGWPAMASMLDGLKRLLGGSPPAPQQDWDEVAPWAERREFGFRSVPGEGFVVDGRLGSKPWRLEWGPSQRPYILGQELRLRSELGLSPDLQLVVMNRSLQEQMEKTVFDQYVEGVQTRIDNQTPPEMRWLVMFPKLPGSAVPELRERFVAHASINEWLQSWLQGPLTEALAAQRVDAAAPVVLMIGRGRLMLRTALAAPEIVPMERWLRLFETAIREAQRVGSEVTASLTPHTGDGPWSASALPDSDRLK